VPVQPGCLVLLAPATPGIRSPARSAPVLLPGSVPVVRAVVQRVAEAAVTVEGEVVGAIGPGLCVLVGVARGDDVTSADRLAQRLWHLRIFEDDEGRMNRSAADLGLAVLVVSQFTLYADTARGRRPSFAAAAAPADAERLVDRVVASLRRLGATVATGRFGAHMAVTLTNDGPVTILLESVPAGAGGTTG